MLRGQSDCMMICMAKTSNAGSNKPQKGRRVFGIVEEVGEIEGQEGEVIGCIDAWVNVS